MTREERVDSLLRLIADATRMLLIRETQIDSVSLGYLRRRIDEIEQLQAEAKAQMYYRRSASEPK